VGVPPATEVAAGDGAGQTKPAELSPSSRSAFRLSTLTDELTLIGGEPELTSEASPGPAPVFWPMTPAEAGFADAVLPLTPAVGES
jgi:hypothetical protein